MEAQRRSAQVAAVSRPRLFRETRWSVLTRACATRSRVEVTGLDDDGIEPGAQPDSPCHEFLCEHGLQPAGRADAERDAKMLQTGCVFHAKPNADSTPNRAPIPRQTEQGFHDCPSANSTRNRAVRWRDGDGDNPWHARRICRAVECC
ncbi:hypothetical protein GCT19_38410 [Paraburkholderia sp. CNPSo 3155]|nr:hypothetical protein [Paraburkholderia atlantica]NUY36058.1 hypothetical protein [Paraburkholderia atlantica]